MMGSVEKIFSDLVQQRKILKSSLIGCTDVEISTIERHFNCILPVAYRQFLAIAGKSAGKIFSGTDIFFPRVLELQNEASELMSELNLSFLVPVDAKVFCMHQGYEILYFQPISDDPPIFQFFEGERSITQPWKRFSEFLKKSIEDHIIQWQDLN